MDAWKIWSSKSILSKMDSSKAKASEHGSSSEGYINMYLSAQVHTDIIRAIDDVL